MDGRFLSCDGVFVLHIHRVDSMTYHSALISTSCEVIFKNLVHPIFFLRLLWQIFTCRGVHIQEPVT